VISLLLFTPLARATPAARRALLRGLGWLAVAALVLVIFSRAARADEAAPALDAGLIEQVRALALGKPAAPGAPRVEVVIGKLDPRLHLAPCARIEPYLPPNSRPWGRSRIGLRCVQGQTPWNVYLPVTVKVWGRALVVPAGAAMGSVLTDADLDEAEVDLAEETSPAVTDRKLVVGRMLAQTLRPGQTVRQGQIKLRQWFAAGDTVRVVATGEGFALEGEGQAITNGVEGQTARVRTESGHIVTGTPSGERRMELSL
jgi:flagella basal body P-ring formation protein FlgA